MAKKMKKILSLSMVIIMAMSLMNLPVFAEETTATYRCHPAHTDTCYNKDGALTCYVSASDAEEHIHTEACIPPSGESAADGGYYTRPINENINLTLYNYGSYINVGEEKALMFGWHKSMVNPPYNNVGRAYEGIDGPAMKTTGEVFNHYGDVYYSNKLYNYFTIDRLLNEDGYPQVAATQKYSSNRNSNEIVDVSLEYLFDKNGPALKTGASTNPLSDYGNMREDAVFTDSVGFNSNYESMRFDMKGDGGLFEITEDGYYYYSCTKTSAYYDQEEGRFLLSDVLIGPSHDGAENFRATRNYARNFLPFNKIDFSNTDQFYQYSDTQWTYITDYAFNSDSAREDLADLWFGFDMDFEFFMPKDGKVDGKDMTFQFSGDDDIWVFIDDVLILDIVGCHGAQLGEINFATGAVNDPNIGFSNDDTNGLVNGTRNNTTLRTLFENALGDDFDPTMFDGETFADYSKHEFKFFYTERGGNISYCALKFNIPQLPADSLSVGKVIETTDGSEVDFITDALSYEFRVLKADENGAATEELYIPAGTEFDIVAADNYENVLGEGTVDEDGYFLLKDGQVALFPEVMKTYGNHKYVVEERIPEAFSGTYGEVEYTATNRGVITAVKTEDGKAEEYLTYYTPALAADESQKVTFTNKIQVDEENPTSITAALTITKNESGSTLPERQETYQFYVQAGYTDDTMQPLSIGTKYTVGDVVKTVAEEGIIELKADETAALTFLTGTSYTVKELTDSNYKYVVSYENAESTVSADEPAAVIVTNTYLPVNVGFQSGQASNISFMLIDKATGEVEFLEKIDIGEQTSFEIPDAEGKISVVFVKQATSGMFWFSEEEVDEALVNAAIECLKDNNPSYKGHNAVAFDEETVTWAFKNNKYVTYTFTCGDAIVDPPEASAPVAPVVPEAPKEEEAPVAPETSAPAEPTLDVPVKGAEVASWTVVDGVTAVYIAANGKVPAVIWTSEAVDDATMAAIVAELGADDEARTVFGMGSHDITYNHNKNKTKTVTYTFG